MKETIMWLLVHVLLFVIILIFIKNFISNELYSILSLLIIAIGAVIWILAKREMGKIVIGIVPNKMITSGIYSKIRHPLYLGIKIFFLGFALYLGSIIGLVLIIFLLIPLHIQRARKEEKEMTKKFGKKYIEYKKRTIF